ncbi:hypothetical protein TTHERM_00497890 (macronuclear) [Tetrahymena thermophila SB210]|uniref:Uncharacterized protein n=1 Tax=Tetrahymena thermophila (strain SB210) TaxID=312017 RepID=I7LY56_TETTS|nr:hypothetical protein TTHERM_00497890 [Tetrahymena thermophila SB210]EAS07735.2 hypothetical protein TTHERM_00497890 [Tetrahymena thermophila SB210]|eukprot:XP_001027977.2 hypothetical protein TTHERM_00497890 [Tetrahymena thermophila SB210]
MSILRQKRKAALDYLLDGKDRLKDTMQISYNKQYDEFLFTEKNVLKNMRDANLLIEKADKVISQIENFDNKQLQKKQSIYAPYFTGQKNTAPVSPKKKTQDEQHQKQTNNSMSMIQSEINGQSISNQRIKTEINDLIQSYQINEEKLKNDNIFVNSVVYNNLQSIKMQNALRMKQLQEKDRNKQFQYRQFTSLGQQQQNKSQSVDVFIPYANERDNLGFIIEPEAQQQRRRKLLNLPIERQKISLIVPPNTDKVLVMKRGVHFFDKGSQLKTTRDDNLILKDIFKQNLQKTNSNDYESNLQQSSKNQQKTEVLIKQQLDEQKINSQINQNLITIQLNKNAQINNPNNSNLIIEEQEKDSYVGYQQADQVKTQQNNVLDSSHNLQSNITTFHNSSQTRHQSQDSLLPHLDNFKYIQNNQNVNNQKYYIPSYQASPATTRVGQSYQNAADSQYINQITDEKSTSVSQMNLINGSIQNSLIENANYGVSSLQIDSINQASQSQNSINGNASIEQFQGIQQSVNDFQQIDSNFNKQVRKNQSLMNIQIQAGSNTDKYNLSIPQSKTLTAFDRKGGKNSYQNEIVLEEKLDASASLIANESKSRIIVSQGCIEVNMKQNKGGQVSEFQIGKFVLMPDQKEEQEVQSIELNNKVAPNSVKKQFFEGNQHFKWKMNALDEAQLIEMIRKQNESKVKLPKIQIYNKKKYVSDQYPAPGDYDPDYSCIEKHYRQVYFDKAIISKSISTSPQKNQNEKMPQLIPKNKSTFLPKNIVPNKEEGYEIMFSELMKDIKKEVRKQKIQNKELQHPMQGLQLNPIPHTHIIELNKNMGNQMSYCKSCLNNIKYYLRADNPTILKKKKYTSFNF